MAVSTKEDTSSSYILNVLLCLQVIMLSNSVEAGRVGQCKTEMYKWRFQNTFFVFWWWVCMCGVEMTLRHYHVYWDQGSAQKCRGHYYFKKWHTSRAFYLPFKKCLQLMHANHLFQYLKVLNTIFTILYTIFHLFFTKYLN